MPLKRLCLLIAPAALLASCGDKQAPANDDGRSSSGEVLEGTISDAMLPVDTVRSQPPLLKIAPTSAASGAAADAQGDEAEEGEAETAPDAAATAPGDGAPAAPANDAAEAE